MSSKVTVFRFQVHSPITRGWLMGGCHATDAFIESVKGRKLEETALEVDVSLLTTQGQYFHPGLGFAKPANPRPEAASASASAPAPAPRADSTGAPQPGDLSSRGITRTALPSA